MTYRHRPRTGSRAGFTYFCRVHTHLPGSHTAHHV